MSTPKGIACPQIAQKASGRGMKDTVSDDVLMVSLGASETDMTLSSSWVLVPVWMGDTG